MNKSDLTIRIHIPCVSKSNELAPTSILRTPLLNSIEKDMQTYVFNEIELSQFAIDYFGGVCTKSNEQFHWISLVTTAKTNLLTMNISGTNRIKVEDSIIFVNTIHRICYGDIL